MTNAGEQAETGTTGRIRRDRDDIRELLLQAAFVEFGERGYEGASTLSIARRADAHQPQINYHFSSKEELWRAAVDRLFADLDEAIPDVTPDAELAYYVIVGAASLPFVHAAEANLLLDGDPFDPKRVESHVEGLIAALLPGIELNP